MRGDRGALQGDIGQILWDSLEVRQVLVRQVAAPAQTSVRGSWGPIGTSWQSGAGFPCQWGVPRKRY